MNQFYIQQLCKTAANAAQQLKAISTLEKNYWLQEIARLIIENQNRIITANELDQKAAREAQKPLAFIDRLSLSTQSIQDLADQLEAIAALKDPIGTVTDLTMQPSGIQVGQMRMPIGVILMIYESRPNVTLEAAALAIKAGNSIILRGGSDAIHTNTILAELISQSLSALQLPEGAAQLVDNLDREVVKGLLQARDSIDVAIPRGGKNLVRMVQEHALVPVIKHLDGICHVYIDDQADLGKAVSIADNAKTQRYGTCNTMETLLVHEAIADQFFERILPVFQSKNVELRLCDQSAKAAEKHNIPFSPAQEDDWDTEYLGPILSVKVVNNLNQALLHIQKHSSGHTDVIVTEHFSRAQLFLKTVDSSSVMVNASSRFADGFEYGLGGEIGISTNKLHVRGPVGLLGLTTQKYIVLGDGHIRT